MHRLRDNVLEVLREAIRARAFLIDTAPNYLHGRAHSALIDALDAASCLGVCNVGDVLITTKVGFCASHDEYEEVIRNSIATKSDFIDHHCMPPAFVRWRTLKTRNEFCERKAYCVFLHNPEVQLKQLTRYELHCRIQSCFGVLEELCHNGVIRSYGVATWNGFGDTTGFKAFEVADLVGIARDIGGKNCHFRAIQLPLSFIRLEAIAAIVNDRGGPLAEAEAFGLDVFASSPLHGGVLPKILDSEFSDAISPGLTSAQAALAFVRSVPAVKVVLVSPSSLTQLHEVMAVRELPLLPIDHLRRLVALIQYGGN